MVANGESTVGRSSGENPTKQSLEASRCSCKKNAIVDGKHARTVQDERAIVKLYERDLGRKGVMALRAVDGRASVGHACVCVFPQRDPFNRPFQYAP